MLLQQELIQALQKELFKQQQQQQQNNNQYYEKQLLPTIAQTQLIAKFLGYFTFHWNHTTKTTTLLQPPIPIMEYIQTAWETKNHLIIMIPWILEFLKMMMNNNPSATKTKISSSSLSPYYQKVLGYLRSIQLSLAQSIYDDHTTLNEDYPKCTSFVTVLYLEGFFSKIIGLEEIQQLSSSTLPPRSSNSLKSGLDQCRLYFPKSFLCATFPHLNTLYKMLLRKPSPTSIHHQSGEKLKTTTPRKLKPYSISTIPTSSTTNTNILFSPIITSKESHNKDEIFRMKLVDSFFHQHPQLKHICDFVVDLSIKAITSDVLPNRITPAIKSEVAATQNKTNENKNGYDNGIVSMAKNDSDWNSHGDQSQGVMKENEMNINSKTQKILHDYLEMYISQSMRGLLTMTHMDEKVKQVFTNITLQIAKQKGIKLVSSFVRTELVKRYEESSSIQNNNDTNCRQKKKCQFLEEHRMVLNRLVTTFQMQRQRTELSPKYDWENINDKMINVHRMLKSILVCSNDEDNGDNKMVVDVVYTFDLKTSIIMEQLASTLNSFLTECLSTTNKEEKGWESSSLISCVRSSIQILSSLGQLGASNIIGDTSIFYSPSCMKSFIDLSLTNNRLSSSDSGQDDNNLTYLIVEMIHAKLIPDIHKVETTFRSILYSSDNLLCKNTCQNFLRDLESCKTDSNNLSELSLNLSEKVTVKDNGMNDEKGIMNSKK